MPLAVTPAFQLPFFICMKESYTALSTRLTIEVSTEPGYRLFWLESTPMDSLPFSLAVCSTPRPEPPATANTTSTPRSNWERASSPPLAGLFHESEVVPTMLELTSTLGLTDLAPWA